MAFKFPIIPALLIFTMSYPCYSKETGYKVSDIPPDLLKNSKAVIRKMNTQFSVSSARTATEEVIMAVTILNENADDLAYFIEYYDKFQRITDIKGKVFDKNGELIKKLTAGDVDDYSAISGFVIYHDIRVKFIDPEIRDYPFTVEYSWKITYNGLFDYPEWQIYPDYNVAIESSEFHLTIPSSLSCRMYYSNLECEKDTMSDNNFKYYHWKVDLQASLISESYSCNLTESTPILYLAPDSFEIGGYSGNSNSWKTLGDWISLLNEDRDSIPPGTEEKIKEMVKDQGSLYDKVCVLYKYLQDKTRYALISIRLGGWQPTPAEAVDRLSYGDCKALSNYMKTLLKTAGIKSYYTLVRAGDDAPDMISGFPSQQFNHAILCIPAEYDTIWLECTSQTLPCGYIGTFTDDRDVLVITEEGGAVWHTKAYSGTENVQSRKALVTLATDGSGTADIYTSWSGALYNKMDWIHSCDQEDKKKRLYQTIQIPEFTLVNFQYDEQRDIIPAITEKLNLNFNNYTTIMGERMILPLNLMNKNRDIPKRTEKRYSEIKIRRSFCETDSISYKIPAGYHVEILPDPVSVSSMFGSYDAHVKTSDNEIIYIRNFSLIKGIYPCSDFPGLVDFITAIVLADEMKMILKQN